MNWDQMMDSSDGMWVHEFFGQVAGRSYGCDTRIRLYQEIVARARKEGLIISDSVAFLQPNCHDDVNYGLLFELGKSGGSSQLQAAAARLCLSFSNEPFTARRFQGEVEFILFPPKKEFGEWMDSLHPAGYYPRYQRRVAS